MIQTGLSPCNFGKCTMTKWRLLFLSLLHHWRANLAVLLGMAVGAGVLTGALIVGDSIRASLRRMTLERLGKIDYAMTAPRFVRQEISDELMKSGEFQKDFSSVAPAILLQGSAENTETSSLATKVNILGVNDGFWKLDSESSPAADAAHAPNGREVALNQELARAIGVKSGDAILIRLDKPDPIPIEAVAGRRTERTVALRLTVGAVLPNSGLGRFGLMPSQQLPLNVFVALDTLQKRLDQSEKINTLFVSSNEEETIANDDQTSKLQTLLHDCSDLTDLGIRLRINQSPSYVSAESSQMILTETETRLIEDCAKELGVSTAPTLTYLANAISVRKREIPYSTVSALDPTITPPFGPLRLSDEYAASPLGESDLLLNEWAAKELQAKIGDPVSLTYYFAGANGELETRVETTFNVAGIVAMNGPANDPGLTPEYPGIQNAATIRDWNPPFPVDLSKIRDADEAYWKEHRATPKAFVSLDKARKIWTSRFGQLTSIRLARGAAESLDHLAFEMSQKLRERVTPESTGLVFQPVKLQGIQASSGASDFGGLFIGFSFFIIFSAMLLVRLFFSLGVEQRSREIGLLLAVGYPPATVRRLFLIEGTALALLGGLLGTALGVGYAALMLWGLQTWWVGAVGTAFLHLAVAPMSLEIGFGAGVICGLLSVWLSARHLTRSQPVSLLAGGHGAGLISASPEQNSRGRRWKIALAGLASLATAASFLAGFRASVETQAILFNVGGMSALTALLSLLSLALRSGKGSVLKPGDWFPIARLGIRNAARHPGRSLLTVGLVASATFIIVAIAANRGGAGSERIEKNSGNGGFSLMAESDAPIVPDLNSAKGRSELGFPSDAEPLFARTRIYPLRFNPGQDASCLNLYRPTQPRILGAPENFIDRGGFDFQSWVDKNPEQKSNPWKLLDEKSADGSIPAIGDANTIQWILHSELGGKFPIQDGAGRPVKLKIIGLLKRSPVQGELVISEENFIRLFPHRSGRQFFFIETDPAQSATLQKTLESSLADFGFDAFPTQERISSYLAVENTYLSTFQALGGLGLLLGTLGLSVVMLRNVIERRGELALLRSLGYRGSALATLVMAENAVLLTAGLVVGAGSAFLAVAPHLATGGASGLPWNSIFLTLLAVFGVGMISGSSAVYSALRAPILRALRAP